MKCLFLLFFSSETTICRIVPPVGATEETSHGGTRCGSGGNSRGGSDSSCSGSNGSSSSELNTKTCRSVASNKKK